MVGSMQPDLRPINRKEYKLFTDWSYEWEEFGQKCRIIIHAGFVTDIASVPKFLWWLGSFQPDGLHRAAALLHDLLYQNRGVLSVDDPQADYQEFDPVLFIWQDRSREFSRKDADDMFLWVMLEAKTPAGTAKTMHKAVRWFGWAAW